MRWIRSLDSRWLRRWTIRLGIAAAIVFAFPALTVMCLISIVGIPLGIVLMLTPFCFVVVALASVVRTTIRRDGPAAVGASLAVSLLLLAAVGALNNAAIDRRAEALRVGDRDSLERPLRAKAIGLVSLDHFGWPRGEAKCNELCQRLLLAGAADRVAVTEQRLEGGQWTAETPALFYRIEQRESCPPVRLPTPQSSGRIDDTRSDEAMHLAIASGRCLVEERGSYGEADAVLTTGCLHRGGNDFSTGLSFRTDTFTAHRASVHLREAGGFVERYRWTGLVVRRHPVVPFPTLVGGHELNMQPGFLRSEVVRNRRSFAEWDVQPARFVHEELGVDLSLRPAAEQKASRSELISRALDAEGPLSPAIQELVHDLFGSAVAAPTNRVDDGTRALMIRALADPRVVAPRETWVVVRESEKAGDAANAELARVLFAKLGATDPALRDADPGYLGFPAAYLASAIAMLPPESVLPYRAELERIARDPVRRRRGVRALPQLAAFGADAVPTLLVLVDAAGEIRRAEQSAPRSGRAGRTPDPEDWQELLRTALLGLCGLGSDARAALPALLEQLRSGALPASGSNGELLLTTLIRLGADAGQVRASFVTESTEAAAKRYDRLVERARTRPDCR